MTMKGIPQGACSLADDPAHFWGHIGLRLPGADHSKWYAVTETEAQKVRQVLANGHSVPEWIVTDTLNNRVLAWRPKQMQRVWLLDDANDGPEGDWKSDLTWNDHCGLPVELYAAMADWADEQLSGGTQDHSANLRQEALSTIERGGFSTRPDGLAATLRHTAIHFVDGTTVAYEADRQNLVTIADGFDEDTAPDVVEISGAENDFESFYPTNTLRMVEIPLIELKAGQRALWEAFE